MKIELPPAGSPSEFSSLHDLVTARLRHLDLPIPRVHAPGPPAARLAYAGHMLRLPIPGIVDANKVIVTGLLSRVAIVEDPAGERRAVLLEDVRVREADLRWYAGKPNPGFAAGEKGRAHAAAAGRPRKLVAP